MSILESAKSNEKSDNKDAAVKPDADTLHTTDPQEHMEGPLSSLMHKAEKSMEKQGTKEDSSTKDQ